MHKTLLWWPTMDLSQLSSFPQAIKRLKDSGIKFLGTGIGADAFVNRFACKVVSKIEEVLSILPELKDPQIESLLLRTCVGLPRFRHVLRFRDPRVISEAINRFVNSDDEALDHILLNGLTDNARIELSVPIRHGGGGLPRAWNVALPAYISARNAYFGSRHHAADRDIIEEMLNIFNSLIPTSADNVQMQDLLAYNTPQHLLSDT
eukprot:Partr_v1_DN25374_c2_g1_i1_m21703